MTPREKVLAWMEADGRITQEWLAEAAGMSDSGVSKWLRGEIKRLADVDKLAGLVRRIRQEHPGASMDWFLDESKSWPPPTSEPDLARLSEFEAKIVRAIREFWPAPAQQEDVLDRLLGRGDYARLPAIVVNSGRGPEDYDRERQAERDARASDNAQTSDDARTRLRGHGSR